MEPFEILGANDDNPRNRLRDLNLSVKTFQLGLRQDLERYAENTVNQQQPPFVTGVETFPFCNLAALLLYAVLETLSSLI